MWEFILGGIGIFSGFLSIFALWIGVCKKLKTELEIFKEGTYFYKEFQSDYKQFNKVFNQFCKDESKLVKMEIRKQNCRYLVLYFDNPYKILNPNEYRFTIGYYYDNKEINPEVKSFLLSKGCQESKLPQVNILLVKFPIKFWPISSIVGPIRSFKTLFAELYANPKKYLFESNFKKGAIICLFSPNQATYAFPYPDSEGFYITKIPMPPYKTDKPKTD